MSNDRFFNKTIRRSSVPNVQAVIYTPNTNFHYFHPIGNAQPRKYSLVENKSSFSIDYPTKQNQNLICLEKQYSKYQTEPIADEESCFSNLFNSCYTKKQQKSIQTQKQYMEINYNLQRRPPKSLFRLQKNQSNTLNSLLTTNRINTTQNISQVIKQPLHNYTLKDQIENKPPFQSVKSSFCQKRQTNIMNHFIKKKIPIFINQKQIQPIANKLNIQQKKKSNSLNCSVIFNYKPTVQQVQLVQSQSMIPLCLAQPQKQNIKPIYQSNKKQTFNSNLRHSSLRESRSPSSNIKRASFDPVVVIHGDADKQYYNLQLKKKDLQHRKVTYSSFKNNNLELAQSITIDQIRQQEPNKIEKISFITNKLTSSRATAQNYEHYLNNLRTSRQKQIVQYSKSLKKSSDYFTPIPTNILDIIQFNQHFYIAKRYSNIYKCTEKNTGFLFVIKKMLKFTLDVNNLCDNFIKQLEIHSKLNHPNIIQLYYVFSDKQFINNNSKTYSNAKYYLALQYGSCSLMDLINKVQEKKVKISQKQCIRYLKDIIDGLLYLHQNGIIHRAIKPSNIIVVNGVCKITDFSTSTKLYQINKCQTSIYSSPQMKKGDMYSYETDSWSLGVIAYEILYGKIKNKQNIYQTIMQAISKNDPIVSSNYRDFIKKLISYEQIFRMSILEASKHELLKKSSQIAQDIDLFCKSIMNL